jgi:hypothetical protein
MVSGPVGSLHEAPKTMTDANAAHLKALCMRLSFLGLKKSGTSP